MPKDNIGEVVCQYCNEKAAVRKNQKSRLYYFCPSCGIVQPSGQSFQNWLLGAAKIYGPEGAPEVLIETKAVASEAAKQAIPIRETPPTISAEISIRETKEPTPKPAPKKSLLDYL